MQNFNATESIHRQLAPPLSPLATLRDQLAPPDSIQAPFSEQALEQLLIQLQFNLRPKAEARMHLEETLLLLSEREQSRIGQDFHDGLGQELAGIAMLGKCLAKRLEAEAHPLAKTAADIATYANAAINSARLLVKGLYPAELSQNGLLSSLEDLAHQTSQRLGICCELQQSGTAPNLCETTKIHVYRIVQESICNAIKHGEARCIIIESRARAGMHTITVTADGLGFHKPTGNAGTGLHLMKYRARLIGAKIDVRKPFIGGCQVTLQIPTEPPQKTQFPRSDDIPN